MKASSLLCATKGFTPDGDPQTLYRTPPEVLSSVWRSPSGVKPLVFTRKRAMSCNLSMAWKTLLRPSKNPQNNQLSFRNASTWKSSYVQCNFGVLLLPFIFVFTECLSLLHRNTFTVLAEQLVGLAHVDTHCFSYCPRSLPFSNT